METNRFFLQKKGVNKIELGIKRDVFQVYELRTCAILNIAIQYRNM